MGKTRIRSVVGAAVLVACVGLPGLASADDSQSETPSRDVVTPEVAASMQATDDEDRRAHTLDQLLVTTGTLGDYHDDNRQLVIVLPSSGSSSFVAADAAALGFSVSIRYEDFEIAEIQEIEAAVENVDWSPAPEVSQPIAWFDPSVGKIKIDSDAPVDTFNSILDRYGDKVLYTGHALTLTSRCTDYQGTQGHWGGAGLNLHGDIVDGGECGGDSSLRYECTSGFGVHNSAGDPRMVTAAHCFNKYAQVDSPGGDSFGSIHSREGWHTVSGENFDCCHDVGQGFDFELIGENNILQGHKIYTQSLSGSPYISVESGNSPASALGPYCFSGMTKYEVCKLDFDISTANFAGYRWYTPGQACCGTGGSFYWFHLYKPLTPGSQLSTLGYGACPGDSGAPIYRYLGDGNLQIAGIVNGGALTEPGPPTPQTVKDCKDYATDVWGTDWGQIVGELNLTLKTIANP